MESIDRSPDRLVVGLLMLAGRAGLLRLRLGGVALSSWGTRAVTEAGIALAEDDRAWPPAADRDAPTPPEGAASSLAPDVVLHDPLCPLTPPAFLLEALAAARSSNAVVVGVRPVTDTIKSVTAARVGSTVDRESLLEIVSPVVLPSWVVRGLRARPDDSDVAALVATLRSSFPVTFLQAPPLAGRVEDASALRLLEASLGLWDET
jgi:2-C-methyl-D-erythritol 4-phosphate cytidylyltransferase